MHFHTDMIASGLRKNSFCLSLHFMFLSYLSRGSYHTYAFPYPHYIYCSFVKYFAVATAAGKAAHRRMFLFMIRTAKSMSIFQLLYSRPETGPATMRAIHITRRSSLGAPQARNNFLSFVYTLLLSKRFLIRPGGQTN